MFELEAKLKVVAFVPLVHYDPVTLELDNNATLTSSLRQPIYKTGRFEFQEIEPKARPTGLGANVRGSQACRTTTAQPAVVAG